MLLRTRLTLILIAVLVLFSLIAGFLLVDRDRRLEARLAREVLQSQRVAWEKALAEQRETLQSTSARLQGWPEFRDAIARRDSDTCARMLAGVRDEAPLVRLDILLPDRGWLCSTASGGARLLDEPMLTRALIEPAVSSGVILGDDRRFHWLRLQRLEIQRARAATAASPSRGAPPAPTAAVASVNSGSFAVILATIDMTATLPALREAMGGDVFLTSLSSRLLQGTNNALFQALNATLPWQAPAIDRFRHDGAWLLAVSLPLTNPAGRTIGMFVSLRDVSESTQRELGGNYLYVVIALTLVLVTGVGVFLYLRNALDPLGRAVSGLEALARGDTNAQVHLSEQRRDDEAGKINQGIGLLRGELLNFQMLRDERHRARKQQERVIREQLRVLARNLDPGSREEVLRELEAGLARASGGELLSLTGRLATLENRNQGENELTVLAGILGRMSGIIATQQGKLLKLLKEVQAAAEARAKLAGLQQELEIARRMQLSILPLTAPNLPNVEVASLMIPAKEVGGDFYDYFMLDEAHLAVIVADVSGKGVPAAFFMAISRTLMRGIARYEKRPAAMISELNDQLAADNEQTMFVTAFYGVLELATGRFVFVNCGHNPPALLDGRGGSTYFPKTRSMALAVMDGLDFIEETVTLQPGETLVLFTDGVTEAQDAQGTLYGEARLHAALIRLDRNVMTRVIPSEILHDIRAFERGAAQADDITCVALRYTGAVADAPVTDLQSPGTT
jgi:phosphoserine phosphatase RsbU/P